MKFICYLSEKTKMTLTEVRDSSKCTREGSLYFIAYLSIRHPLFGTYCCFLKKHKE